MMSCSRSRWRLQAFRQPDGADGIDVHGAAGELLSLVGPNGAGKTTLMRCIADGRERSDGNGAISGQTIERLPPDRIVGLGVGRKFQTANVFETLTVADACASRARKSDPPSFLRASPALALPAAARAVVESRVWPSGSARRRASSATARSRRWSSRWCWRSSPGAAAGRADRRADKRRAQALPGSSPSWRHAAAVRPAGRARSRFRARDLLAHHRAASGTRSRSTAPSPKSSTSPDPRDLHRTTIVRNRRADA